MGITDEAYWQAILVERLKKAQQEQQERIKETLDSTVLGNCSSTFTVSSPYAGNLTANLPHLGTPLTVKHGHISMTSKDLDHEAAKVSLEVLSNMWVMRWQDKWVDKEELTEDDFWRIAFVRLENVNKLERHILADNMQYVYRIIE